MSTTWETAESLQEFQLLTMEMRMYVVLRLDEKPSLSRIGVHGELLHALKLYHNHPAKSQAISSSTSWRTNG